ncbi:MAG: AAA family ATPase [Myxococcales bacterium]|nr:AAA family ATPase [Myxococcales bacterium]MCB9733176.1 AAA family ATPase [Deltaproteobacteria bacterium]
MHVDPTELAARSARLDHAAAALKAHFVGIDAVIDDLVRAVRVWYLMPEVLSRPVVVCLWGMTGVGKTDLVRRLVRELALDQRFVEIEPSHADESRWIRSVREAFSLNGIDDGEPAVVLFDEVQRFNTLDHEGLPIQRTQFGDLWELLSDGRLSRRDRSDLDSFLAELSFDARAHARRKESGDSDADDILVPSSYEAMQFRRHANAALDAEGLLGLDKRVMLERLREHARSGALYAPVDHSKTLVIVSGNLDDVFEPARAVAEADVDADIFHAFAERVTIIDVKRALARRFRPEQVARFGNVHLVYPSLRRADFEALIARELGRIAARTRERFGVALDVGATVNELVYRNGVFPAQGVRPVLSTITDVVEVPLADLVFRAVAGGHERVALDYDAVRGALVAEVGPERVELPYVGRLEDARRRAVRDVTANVAVHEAGHAVAYVVLFGLAPVQLTARVASRDVGGFTFPHEMHDTFDAVRRQVAVLLAGKEAEQLVFGRDLASTGDGDDRARATVLLADGLRRHGFEPDFQAAYGLAEPHDLGAAGTDARIEAAMARLARFAGEILAERRELLGQLALALEAAGSLDAAAIAALARRHGVEAAVEPEGFLVVPPYRRHLAAFAGGAGGERGDHDGGDGADAGRDV